MNLKEKICFQLNEILLAKIEETNLVIAQTKEARNADTKSSAGDKYETGREMMQIEIDKNEAQVHKNQILRNELLKINFQKQFDKVEFGSLVTTQQDKYFFSIGWGKLVVDNETYFVISLASPLGVLMKDKKQGDKFIFQGKEIIIKEII